MSNDRVFKRAFADWPSYLADSQPAAWKAWLKLSEQEREAAITRAADYAEGVKAKRLRLCSFGVYLAERRWEKLPPPAPAKMQDVDATAFGPAWCFVRMRQLVTMPPEPGPRPSAYIADILARNDVEAHAERLRRQAAFGWPAVNWLHDGAAQRRGIRVTAALEALAKTLLEPVPVGSAMFEAWRAWHATNGKPWLPDPGDQRVVFFPRDGPGGLARFEQAVREGRQEGSGDDGGGQEAA